MFLSDYLYCQSDITLFYSNKKCVLGQSKLVGRFFLRFFLFFTSPIILHDLISGIYLFFYDVDLYLILISQPIYVQYLKSQDFQ